MHLLVEQEVAVERWEPVGVAIADTFATVPAAVAALSPDRLPGQFRYLPAVEAGVWRHIELDADGEILIAVDRRLQHP
jgi:hypothetical protein